MSKHPASRIRPVLHILMAVSYAAMGLSLFTFWSPEGLPATNKYVIATVLVVYAVYRSWRIRRSMTPEENPTDETN